MNERNNVKAKKIKANSISIIPNPTTKIEESQ